MVLFLISLSNVAIIAFGFFLGYGVHLLADSFTVQGIEPFYPWKMRSAGFIKTGSVVETSIFIFLILADVIVFVGVVKSFF